MEILIRELAFQSKTSTKQRTITKFQQIEQNELPKLIKFWNMLEKRVADGIEQRKTEIKNWNIAKNGEDFEDDDDKINLYENFDWYKRVPN